MSAATPEANRRRALTPGSPLTAVRGVGPVRAEALAAAGFRQVGDLLQHLPLRYEDRRRVIGVDEIVEPGAVTLRGQIEGLRPVRIRRRGLSLVRGRVLAAEGELAVVWFNRPYIASQIESRQKYLLHGDVRRRGDRWELVNPSVERPERARLAGRVVPVYPRAGDVGPAQVRALQEEVAGRLDFSTLEDPLTPDLRERHGLPDLGSALAALHRPSDSADVGELNRRTTRAHARLVYGEMLRLQLELALVRREARSMRKAHVYRDVLQSRRRVERVLPFRLTAAQTRAVDEILADLESTRPMMRLLQGDVGSGKTAVAALALAVAAESGLQAALMAPTELLAEQHEQAILRLLGGRYPTVLLTASAGDLERKRDRLRTGETSIAVGTHALIQERVDFDRLGLVIVDEQHRFGVAQRRSLQRKARRPDLLVMTATPIPRSLALTVYGDLSTSIIDQLPPGRAPVTTRVLPHSRRGQIHDWLETRLAAGERAYVVLPLIEESESLAAESIAGLGRQIAERFASFRPAVLHGRTEAAERAAAMQAFASGNCRLLIATTLVEVGIDVPEASVMLIESAERFGLSQLHQLRGRVGRGEARSHCIALHGRLSDDARRRLEIFAETDDGFRLAEADLGIRGPGDVLGTRQSGLPSFSLTDLLRDRRWIERARADARELVTADVSKAQRLAASLGRRQPDAEPFSGG